MPAKSQQQLKFIYANRDKYKSKKKAPKDKKWLFDDEWTSGVKMKSLPKKVESFNHIMDFETFNESIFGKKSIFRTQDLRKEVDYEYLLDNKDKVEIKGENYKKYKSGDKVYVDGIEVKVSPVDIKKFKQTLFL